MIFNYFLGGQAWYHLCSTSPALPAFVPRCFIEGVLGSCAVSHISSLNVSLARPLHLPLVAL